MSGPDWATTQAMSGAMARNAAAGAMAAGIKPIQQDDPSLIIKFLGAWAASSAAGTYAIGGAEFMDFATSFTGGLGAAVGYTAGCYLASDPLSDQKGAVASVMQNTSKNYKMIIPVAGAIAVPAIASGTLDTDVAILAAGAVAGGYIVSYYYTNK